MAFAKEKGECLCQRCGHWWIAKKIGDRYIEPKSCAGCKNKGWNQPRVYAGKYHPDAVMAVRTKPTGRATSLSSKYKELYRTFQRGDIITDEIRIPDSTLVTFKKRGILFVGYVFDLTYDKTQYLIKANENGIVSNFYFYPDEFEVKNNKALRNQKVKPCRLYILRKRSLEAERAYFSNKDESKDFELREEYAITKDRFTKAENNATAEELAEYNEQVFRFIGKGQELG